MRHSASYAAMRTCEVKAGLCFLSESPEPGHPHSKEPYPVAQILYPTGAKAELDGLPHRLRYLP